MAPDDRRRSIIRAVIPLLLRQGASVTTREMAEAAGVAEGTIFRVFPDKHSLLHEALAAVIDPAAAVERLDTIDRGSPLENQLGAATSILMERVEEVLALITVLHSLSEAEHRRGAGPPAFVTEANAAIIAALARLLARHSHRLRLPPERAAAVMSALIVASGHPVITPGNRITTWEIVDVLMGGIMEPAPEAVGLEKG